MRAWAHRLRHGRHPDQYRHLSGEALAWVWRHRAFGPGYLVRYWRLLLLRLRHPDVVTRGLVLLGRGVTVETVPGRGLLDIGAFVHVGDRCALRAHEGVMRVGDKAVLGTDVRLTCWLDLEVGASTLIADWAYVADFDHVHADPGRPIKDQGLAMTPLRIGPGSWLGIRSTVLRGSVLGEGTVVAAHAVVRGVHPDHVVLAGAPARVVADRLERWEKGEELRLAFADLAQWHERVGRGGTGTGPLGGERTDPAGHRAEHPGDSPGD